MSDTQPEEEGGERPVAAVGDGLDEVFGRFMAHALEFFDLVGSEVIEVGEAGHHICLDELLNDFLPQAFYIQAVSAGVVLQCFFKLCWASHVFTAHGDFFVAEGEIGIAGGASGGEGVRFFSASAFFCQGLDHLGYDFASLLDNDLVTDADVLALDFLAVVQGSSGYGGACEKNGFKVGYRGNSAGSPDLDFDALESGGGFFG